MSDAYILSFFDLCDQDHDGYITLDELRKIFKDKSFDEKFFTDYVKLFDKNKDGRISRAEYAETVSKISPKDKEFTIWHDIFRMFDVNNDGFITVSEVEKVLKEIGTKGITYTAKDFENFVHAYDKNADGKIDYEEFLQFLKGQ